jgi:uncharacterized protein (TIGR03083 family)
MDKDTIVGGLAAEWMAIEGLLAGLDEAEWAAPTPCPGWSVHDVTSHIMGTELALCGEQPAPCLADLRGRPHVHNDIGELNEVWVESLRTEPPARMLEQLRAVTARRLDALTGMSDEDFHAPSWTPAGQATYARFMQIRAFDTWMHEQDIRDAAAQPGNEDGPGAALSVDEITLALGYLVGKRAGAPDGSSVSFELTGPLARRMHVVVDGRARLAGQLPGPATATIRLPLGTFTRLCGGRVSPDQVSDLITIEGDQGLGGQIVGALAYTI